MNETIKIPEKGGMRGEIKIMTYKAGTHLALAKYVEKYLEIKNNFSKKIADEYKEILDRLYKSFEIQDPMVCKNLIMQAANYGMDIIIQRLCGINTYSLNINYGEIGTGTTTPAITDTALTSPIKRVGAPVTQDSGNNEAILQFFYPDSSLQPSSTVTISIASPGVITWTGHKLVNGCIVTFATTGALPTGITAGTPYYVVSATTNTFEISATSGGSPINTSGSQSGTQTATCTSIILSEFGTFVDGSSTIGTGQLFNHALFATTYTKSSGTDITVQVSFTISQ